MNANRARLLSVGLAAGLAIAGCSASATSAPSAPSKTTGSPARSVPPATPTSSPTSAASPGLAAATAIVKALGGTVAAGAPTLVLDADPISAQAGTYVQYGDWQVAWNSHGTLRWVFATATASASQTRSQAEIAASVDVTAKALGLSLGSPETLTYDGSAGDWEADWPRKIDGVMARGDGTAIALLPDGSFNSYRYSESATAPRPASLLSEAQARAAFKTCRSSTAGAAKSETCTAQLVWLRPATASPDQSLQLCWEVAYAWKQGDQVGASYQDLDAGTGAIVDSGATS
jgi:hypothetical protein